MKIGGKWVEMVEDKYVSHIAHVEQEVILKPQTVNIIKAKVRDMGHYSPGQTLKVRELVNHEINNEPWLKVVSGIAYLEPIRSVPIMVLNHTSKTIRLNKDSEIAEVIGGEVEIEEEDVMVARERVNTMLYRDQIQGYGRYKGDRARNFRPFLTRERREQKLEPRTDNSTWGEEG
jgi:hypothetical protein